MRYPIPAARHRVEEVIQRSRFITTLAHAPSVDAAREFIDRVRAEFPDATHNCWAYAAGPPGDTAFVGMSDDGEPHGTAGRPMLNILHHGGVGEIAAVVTRYYGGVKLGTGGLARAYSGGVQLALESLPTVERVDRVEGVVEVDYASVETIRRVLADLDVVTADERFGGTVEFVVEVPVEAVADLETAVAEATRGSGTVRMTADPAEGGAAGPSQETTE
jgi:uncharacterized YigZ family protein